MNILLSIPATSPIIDGLYSALTHIEHTIFLWYFGQQSIYDICDRQKIDLFFCHNTHITPITLEAIHTYQIPTVVFGLSHNFTEKKLTCLLENIQLDINPEYYILQSAANLVSTIDLPVCDVLYICDQQHAHLHSYIQDLNQNNISFKIVGKSKLPYIEYVGEIDISTRCSLCKTAKIIILDNIDYIYDVAINNGFSIVAQQNPIYPVFTSDTLIKNIQHFLTDDKHKKSISKVAYSQAIQNTYYHRAADIFTKLNLSEITEQCLSQTSKVLE